LSVGANRLLTALLIAGYDTSPVGNSEMLPFLTLGFNTGTYLGELTLVTLVVINRVALLGDRQQ
jgi:hypothetical protein